MRIELMSNELLVHFQVISAFESVLGSCIPRDIAERRVGDIGQSWANISLAQEILNWKPKRTLNQMCESALNWQKKNPKGYND